MPVPPRIPHSRVPEIVLAVHGKVLAQPEVTATAVILGSKTVNDFHDYIVFVGHRPNSDTTIPVSRTSPGGYAPNDTEMVPVPIEVAAANASDDMQAALLRAREIFAAVERGVLEDQNLGLGKGVSATIGSDVNWLMVHTDKAAEVYVSFDVNVKVAL